MESVNKNNIQDITWFEDLFRTHFAPLCQFAMNFTGSDLDDAKEIVHDVFIKVWEKMDSLPPDVNYKSYLYKSVNNRGLNFIRDRKKLVQLDQISEEKYSSSLAEMEEKELERAIELAIHSLPDKCREVFELSRYEGLTYKSIAEKMAVSVKTVEAQMSKALRLLREHLAEFLSLIILYLII
ncbi:MAG: RNA polymerase sigma-70 factor [Bacteroidetes bacterium]|nr:RNA polymerase sigma-70 factor [Bacteroidota bacterium]